MNNSFIAYKWSKSYVPATAVEMLHVLCSRAALCSGDPSESSVTLPEPPVPRTSMHLFEYLWCWLVCVASASNSELMCGRDGAFWIFPFEISSASL